MRKSLILAAALTALAVPALAADMPVKAPPFTAPASSPWYCGVGTEADVAQSNVSGTNLFATSLVSGGLTATGGSIDGACGYLSANPQRWWRVQIEGGWSNIKGTNVAAATPGASGSSAFIAQRWHATQEFDIGFELIQRIFAVLPNLGTASLFPSFTPVLPSNVSVGVPHQYVGGGLREFGIDGRFGAASGQTIGLAPMVKSGFIWCTLNAAGQCNGGALDAYAWVAFPVKGMTFGNVGATNGAPLTVNAGANMGTQYGLGLNYDFGL
jgi:hypothetical protein